jgi:hypothetical protein
MKFREKYYYCQGNITNEHLKSFLLIQFKQIATQLPISMLVFVRQQVNSNNQEKNKEFLLYTNKSKKKISSEELNYWNSDFWIEDSFPVLEISKINLCKDSSSYICPLIETSCQFDFLLLWCDKNLSISQKEFGEFQALLLKEYIYIYHIYEQQINEINILEYLIHRIGHELRSPLAQIDILAETIRLSLPRDPCQKQASLIREAISRFNTELTNLLECGKKVRQKFEYCDLQVILQESIHDLQFLIKTKKIRLNYAKQEALICVDYFQIKQVFENLLNNAIYFSPVGGEILCDWKLFQEEILITITDQGSGLSSEDIKNIFTPFYSRRDGGIGLGLTIVKKIILDHGGNIWGENMPGGGARFSFTLPRQGVKNMMMLKSQQASNPGSTHW